MSNRNNQSRRTSHRLPVLSDNDRIILNIYLNMYNQTVRDIDLVYQQLDLMYENLNNIRNIINVVTGVSGSMNSTTTTEQETNPFTFGTFARPSSHSYYNTDNNSNLSLSSRLYLVDFARYLLDSYDNETETTNNRETEERERTRVRSRVGVNTRRRPTSSVFNTESINFNNIAGGVSRRLFPGLASFYDNVPVYPTVEQIASGTRRVLYSNIEEPLNVSCPITLERFDSESEVLQILGCNHIFNPNSLQQWFQSNVRCPICRYDIRDYVPVNNRRRRYNYEETKEEETQGEETNEETPTAYSSESSGSTLHSASPEPRSRNTIPEPADNTEFISNLTSVTENLLSDLFSSSFPNTQFNFNGTTYTVDLSNNEIVFQGYIHPNDDEL
jgi:hypothetical protein